MVSRHGAANDAVQALFEKYPPTVAQLATIVRTYVRTTLGDVIEEADTSANIVGYSTSAGYKGLVCTIILSKTGVKLGIAGSAGMPDPGGLLEGTGKKHKYVQVRNAADLDNSALRDLLTTAAARTRATA